MLIEMSGSLWCSLLMFSQLLLIEIPMIWRRTMILYPGFQMGPELFCFVFSVVFLGSVVLSVFLAICSIFELEAAISTVLQHFGVRTSHLPWYLQHFGAQTFHVGWYFATRVHLGFV
jgi:hypothetical protein